MTRSSILLMLLAACASSPETGPREAAPNEEQREQDLRDAEAKRRDFQAVIVRLDQAMDSYVRALSNRGEIRADQEAERLERSIRETVLDLGPVRVGSDQPSPRSGDNFVRLKAAAADSSMRHQQAVALAALGFSGQYEVMDLILQGAQLSDPFLVDRAVLGLAVLRAPTTPPGVLAAIAERKDYPEDGRVQAAWALYQIQTRSERQEEIVAVWRRFLTEQRDTMPAGVLATAVRGLGLSRDPANADLVATFLRHHVARVRMAATIALARMNAQKYADELIALLSPQETVPNVRLHARKALASLAGGDDYGYDIAAWRKVFDRGR